MNLKAVVKVLKAVLEAFLGIGGAAFIIVLILIFGLLRRKK